MATTLLDREQKRLLKRFHTLLGKANLGSVSKEAILAGYGVESSKDLTAYELLEICNRLDKICNPEAAELDKWRKRLIAAIFAWRRAMGSASSMAEVKAIACRASKAESFNRIPLQQLRSLYSAFTKMSKDLKEVKTLTVDEIDYLKLMNLRLKVEN